MHFYMFESFQLESLYVTNLLHRFSVNVCSEGTREESKELPVLSLLHVLWPLCVGISLDVIEAQCMGTWLQVTEEQNPRRLDKSRGWLKRANSAK